MAPNRYFHIAFIGGTLLFFIFCQTAISGPQDSLAPLPQTGQVDSFASGDDGDLHMGVQWPDPRFIDNNDGTISDLLTGLIWLKNPFCFDLMNWYDALEACNNLSDGDCGLSDGSRPGDWHLPNVRELFSLIDHGNFGPALPSGNPFTPYTGLYSIDYWSSTTYDGHSDYAWYMSTEGHLNFGIVGTDDNKEYDRVVWPVRNVIAKTASIIVEAEDYDQGGQNVAYFDTTPGNAGRRYRAGDVDIWFYPPNVYYTGANATGEWLNYSIDIPYNGSYRLSIKAATPYSNRRVHVEFNGVDETGSLTIPKSGGWSTWIAFSTNVTLKSGQQLMRLAIDYGGINIDLILLEYLGN